MARIMKTNVLITILLCVSYISCIDASTPAATPVRMRLSEALVLIAREYPDLNLNFIYDDLDSFIVSCDPLECGSPDALKRLVRNFPVKISLRNGAVYAEALQRGPYRFSGHAVGEAGEGIPCASLMLLNPSDSTVITYSMTDVDGLFSIPCNRREVILKLSSVGYNPVVRKVRSGNLGDINMNVKPVNLRNLSVNAERVAIETDKTVFIPTKREKNAAHGGADLILAMGIPLLSVSPLDKVITTIDGEETAVYIDFLPADKEQIAGLRPQDVKKVEVYDYPQDIRFQGARHVVNFILVKYEYGGYTKLDGSQSAPVPAGSVSVNSKFATGKMTYDLSAGCNYGIWHDTRVTYDADYDFNDYGISWLRDGNNDFIRNGPEYVTLRAVYSADQTVVSNSLGFVGSVDKDNTVYKDDFPSVKYGEALSQSSSRFRSRSANWQGSYSFSPVSSWMFTITPTLKYSRNNLTYLYSAEENGPGDLNISEICNISGENAWFGVLGLAGMHQWQRNTLSVATFGEFSNNRLDYRGTTPSRTESTTGAVGLRVGGSFQIGNVTVAPSARVYWLRSRFDNVRMSFWLPAYYIDLDWQINSRNKMSVFSEMSNWTIGVAFRSPNVIIRNMYDAVTGNPSLKPTLYNSVGAKYQCNLTKSIFLSAFCNYRRWTKPDTYLYAPVAIEGKELMLRSIVNDGYFGELQYGVSGSARFFDNSLSLWSSLSANYSRRGGLQNYSGNFGVASGGANYYLRNFYFSLYIVSSQRGMTTHVRRHGTP